MAGQIDELRRAIEHLESQRSALGNETTDALLRTFHQQIARIEVGDGQASNHVAAEDTEPASVRIVTCLVLHIQPTKQETANKVILQGFNAVSEIVRAFGGKVRGVKNGFMICAFEEEPDRAAQAALEVKKRLYGFSEETEAAGEGGAVFRIGLATGRMTESKGSVKRPGEVIDMALLICQRAPARAVLISRQMRAYLRTNFDLEQTAPIKVNDQELQVVILTGMHGGDLERTPSPFFRKVFIGRASQLDEILSRIENLGGGTGGVLAISGEPGIGKSRLMEEAQRAARMVSWYAGRCRPGETTMPLGAWNDLLLSLIGADPLQPATSIEQSLREWLEERELGDHLRVLSMQLGLESPEGISAYRFMGLLAEAWRVILAWMVQQRPAVITLDEVHQMDALSLHLFEMLTPYVQELPLLWVLLMQPSFYGQACEMMLTRQSQQLGDWYRYIGLPPLEKDEIQLLVRGLLSQPMPASFEEPFADQIHGNPMAAIHALRLLIERRTLTRDARGTWQVSALAMRDRIPDSLETIIEQRVALLPEDARALLNLAAAAGNALLPAIFDAITPTNRAENQKYLRTINYFDDDNRFGSAALLAVIANQIDPAKRTAIYEQITTVIGQRMQLSGPWLALFAHHLGEAGQPQKALRLYQEAKNWAYERGALQEVSETLESMRRLIDKDQNPDQYARLLIEQQDLLVQQQEDRERSLELLHEAYDLWMKVENVPEAADTLMRAAVFHEGTSKELECYKDAEKLLERIDKRHPMLSRVFLRQSLYFRTLRKDTEADELFERARKFANQIPDYAALAEINFETGRVLRDNRRLRDAHKCFNQALAHYSQLSGAYLDQQILTRNYLGDFYNHTGQPLDGEYFLLEAVSDSAHGSDLVRLAPYITLSECYGTQARWAEALEVLSEAPAELDSVDMPIQFWVGRWQFELGDTVDGLERMRTHLPEENLECLLIFIDCLLESGKVAEARIRLERLKKQDRIKDYRSPFPLEGYLNRSQGRLEASTGRYASAFPLLQAATQAFDREGFTTLAISTRRVAAQVLIERGTKQDLDLAKRIIDDRINVIRTHRLSVNAEAGRLQNLRKRLTTGLEGG